MIHHNINTLTNTKVLYKYYNIYSGVITFLRLGQVVGGTGVVGSLCIVWVSTILVLITAISMSAISTNGEVKAGGGFQCFFLPIFDQRDKNIHNYLKIET